MSGFTGAILSGVGAASALGSILFGDAGAVVLGPVVFTDMEVPASIRWGIQHRLTVHKMPGGKRVIDAMGRDDADISWSGVFMGLDHGAVRQFQLQELCASGQVVPLSWGTHVYSVVVAQFSCEDVAFHSRYSITCTVLRDESADPSLAPASLLGQITDDINQAVSVATTVLDVVGVGSALVSQLTATQATVQVANATPTGSASSPSNASFAAGTAASAAVVASVASCQTQAAAVQTAAETALGGIVATSGAAGNPLGSASATKATANLQAATTQSAADGVARLVQAMCGRMTDNLTITSGATDAAETFDATVPPLQIIGGSTGQTITAFGGNLFAVAAVQLGDPTQWWRIMMASNLALPDLNSDFLLSGQNTLTIPDAIQAPSDGIPDLLGSTIL